MTKNFDYMESSVPHEYFAQFRDIVFLVDQTGKIIYSDRLSEKLNSPRTKKIIDISELFPDFLETLKEALSQKSKIEPPFEYITLTNEARTLCARCYNIGGVASSSFSGYFLVTLHNPNATGFMFDLLSEKPREYIKNFTRENIRQFIYFSNEMKNFVAIFNDKLSEGDFNQALSQNAIKYIDDQINYFRNFYLQQNKLLQSKNYEYTLRNPNQILLGSLLADMEKHMGNITVEIEDRKQADNLIVRGEKNWLSYAFKNIASFITTNFPEIDPLRIKIFKKTDRNQIYLEFDFKDLVAEHFEFLVYSGDGNSKEHGEYSMFFNCYKIIDMNRGNLRFDEKRKILSLTLPMLARDFGHNKIIVLVADADWKSRHRCLEVLGNLSKRDVAYFEASDPQGALRMITEIEPDIVIADPFFYVDDANVKSFIESIYLSVPAQKPEVILFSHFNQIFDKLGELIESFNVSLLRKEITDFELYMILARAVDNARNVKVLDDLAQNARRISEVDSLTGAFNRSFYDQLVKRELNKAKKGGTYLSLILTDIDNFKHYNDVNGHLAGDHLLREFVNLLKENVRATDYVTRYGGEEFIVVLINAFPKSVMNIAEKLRLAVEKYKFKYQIKQPSGNLTASFGVSNFPSDGNTPEALFKAADYRLYNSKKFGRNQVSGS